MEDMGPKPGPGYSIERLNVNGDYDPGNCIWATQKQQARNTRVNHLIEFNGRMVPLASAVEELGLKYNTILYRLKRGWPVREALYGRGA